MAEKSDKKIKLIDMRRTWFRCESGEVVNLEESTSEQFDAFITKYLEIEDVDRSEWPLLLRWRAVNFAVKNGQFLELVDPPENDGKSASEAG
jgi:hypothetical protein